MTTYQEPWILTATGRRVHLAYPRPEEIRLEDIAHALANLCRFTGHTKYPYSVAAHSVYTCDVEPGEFINAYGSQIRGALKQHCLLHDATEAYLGDVASPLKRLLPEYKAIERRWSDAIAERFGLSPYADVRSGLTHHADRVALAAERAHLLHPGEPHGCFDIDLPSFDTPPFGPSVSFGERAKELFLERAREYGIT